VLDELHRITGLYVFYSVDSVAGALGESLFGAAKNLNNFFYMHFGVGLGGTLVANRSAYKGANGNATEIGHVPIVPNGKECYCGNRGCLERYLSLHALAEALGRAEIKDRGRDLLVQMLADEDAALMRWCREAAGHLRNAVCMIENLLDPETIVIGDRRQRPWSSGSFHWPSRCRARCVLVQQPRKSGFLLSQHDEASSLLGAAVPADLRNAVTAL
jgi:predicted NBD/HSP70 family sugar kinase